MKYFLSAFLCCFSCAVAFIAHLSNARSCFRCLYAAELDPFELRGKTAPNRADMNPFQIREEARTKAMAAEINADENLRILVQDPRIKSLIILLRNLNPDEIKEAYEKEFGNDEFVQSAKQRIFELMDKYR